MIRFPAGGGPHAHPGPDTPPTSRRGEPAAREEPPPEDELSPEAHAGPDKGTIMAEPLGPLHEPGVASCSSPRPTRRPRTGSRTSSPPATPTLVRPGCAPP